MEPITLIMGTLILIGTTMFSSPESPDVQVQAIEEPAPEVRYGRDRFYYSEIDGYYISDLTPAPVMPDGCDLPIHITDLQKPINNNQKITVTSVTVSCEV
jgi:hypothetical protein